MILSLDYHDYQEMALHLVRAAHEAGRAILPFFHSDLCVRVKADDSPVTAADMAAEAIILERLAAYAPTIPIIAEERVSGGDIPSVGETFFLVDPLDGTREFIDGRDSFTVNIALIVDKRPLMGVVYAPAHGALYVTLEKNKAFEARVEARETLLDAGGLAFHEMRAKPVVMTALRALVSRSHGDAETDAFLQDYMIAEKRPIGSSLKFCLVARGEADLYPRFGRTMEWDTAAGDAVLTAAGGDMKTVSGSLFLYGKAKSGFANPGFICWGQRPDVR